MKKTLSALLASSALLLAAETFTGTVTDSMCGGDHKAMKMGADEKCARECVRMGSKYALWDGKTSTVLSDQKTAGKLAGQKVTVSGTLDAKTKTIQVSSISAAK
jgi:hypothetical protein